MIRRALLLVLPLILVWGNNLRGFTDGLPERGIIRLANKASFIHRYTAPDWTPLNIESVVVAGDSLRTGVDGRTVVYLDNRTLIAMMPNTTMQFLPEKSALSSIRLFEGSVFVIVKNMAVGEFVVVTDSGSAASAGGHFIVHTTQKQNSMVYAIDGTINTFVTGMDQNRGQLLPGRMRSFALGEPQLNRTLPINVKAEEFEWRAYHWYFKEFKRIEDNYNFSLYKDVVTDQTDNNLINYRLSALRIEEINIDFYDQDRYLRYIIPNHLRILNDEKLEFKGKILPADPKKQFIYEINKKRYKLEVDEKGEFSFINRLPSGIQELIFYQKNGEFLEKIKRFDLKIMDMPGDDREIKEFFSGLAHDFEIRDIFSLEKKISTEYRDKFGGDYFKFSDSCNQAFRNTDDVHLEVLPQKISYPFGKIYVECIVVFAYIDRVSGARLIDRYLDTFTLVREGDFYKIASKEKGIFFSYFKNLFENSGGILEGTILDEARNTPVPNATIEILGTALRATTDALGRYVIRSIPPGTYNIRVTRPGYATATVANVSIFQATSPTGFNLGSQITFDGGDKGFR